MAGGASERSQGGGVDILGGQSTDAGMGGRILIGKKTNARKIYIPYCYIIIKTYTRNVLPLQTIKRVEKVTLST